MSRAAQHDAVESVLLQVAVAVQRASDAAHGVERDAGGEHLVVPLSRAGSELNAIWRRLWEAVHLPPSGSEQLVLGTDGLAQVRDEAGQDASGATPTLGGVNEEHMAQVELVLFEMSGARKRAAKVARALAKDDAEPHLVEAVEHAERELEAVIDAFFKNTYFHVPKDQLALS